MKGRLKNLILNFKDKKVLVIGDIMLDSTIEGSVLRISPEAPVPILNVMRENNNAGGAANVAVNIKNLGGVPFLCGVVGNDEANDNLVMLFKNEGISTEGIIIDARKSTIIKERVISKNNQLLRIDYEDVEAISPEIEMKLLHQIQRTIPAADIVLISDFAKGTVTQKLANEIIALAEKYRKLVVADFKPINTLYYEKIKLGIINEEELSLIVNAKIENDDFLKDAMKRLSAKIQSDIMVTRGAKGMTIYEKNGSFSIIPGKKIEVFDVSGAGDAVSATTAISLASGATLKEAAILANYAGSIVVTKHGMTTLHLNELLGLFRGEISSYLWENIKVKQSVIENQLDKIEQIVHLIHEAYKNQKKILVFGNGGSAADAQHFAGELVGRFKLQRVALPAIALTTDTSIITAIANDFGFEQIFERQIEALANPDDVVIGISTSGSSPNILKGIQKAKQIGAKTIGFTGKDGGDIANIADICLIVPSNNVSRIQETHITIIHIICELLENEMFGIKEEIL